MKREIRRFQSRKLFFHGMRSRKVEMMLAREKRLLTLWSVEWSEQVDWWIGALRRNAFIRNKLVGMYVCVCTWILYRPRQHMQDH